MFSFSRLNFSIIICHEEDYSFENKNKSLLYSLIDFQAILTFYELYRSWQR